MRNLFVKLFTLVTCMVTVSALAGSTRITKGQMEAWTNSISTGVTALLITGGNGVVHAAGPQAFPGLVVLPFIDGSYPPWYPSHHCELDYNAINIGNGVLIMRGENPKAAFDAFGEIKVSMMIDGQPVQTDDKPLKPALDTILLDIPDFPVGARVFAKPVTHIIAPEQLSPGIHTYKVLVDHPDPIEDVTYVGEFVMEGADDPACTGE